MGVKHRQAVEALPPGLMHRDEKSVLYLLAAETNDQRFEWSHDRKKLLRLLDVPDDDAGRKWLQRRLKGLEDAGWIDRRPQQRLDGGRWGWGLIRLSFREMGSMSVDQYVGGLKPTERAQARRGDNPGTFRHRTDARNTTRDDRGRFTGGQSTTVRVDNQPPSAVGQTTTGPTDAGPPLIPDPGHRTRTTRTIAPDGAGEEEEGLEDKKREAIAALAARWSLDNIDKKEAL